MFLWRTMALRTDPSITRSKEEAKARAESLRKQIVDGGKDFATITRENSDSPSKTKGGECCCEDFHAPTYSRYPNQPQHQYKPQLTV